MPQFTEYLPLAQLTITNRFPQTEMFSNTVFMETSRSSFPVTSPTFHRGARVGTEERDPARTGPRGSCLRKARWWSVAVARQSWAGRAER